MGCFKRLWVMAFWMAIAVPNGVAADLAQGFADPQRTKDLEKALLPSGLLGPVTVQREMEGP